MKSALFLCLILLTGCMRPLNVQTQYLSKDYLASAYVNTPDPHLTKPDIGQRLIIEWSLHKCDLHKDDLHMHIIVRLKNREERSMNLKLCKTRGLYLYPVTNEAYCKSGGISTYKVEIIGSGKILHSWHHPLWVELITFEDKQN